MVVTIQAIEELVSFQKALLRSVSDAYPSASDFRWLLDFPKNGTITAASFSWRFERHGAGMRFVREGAPPNLVVNMHKAFDAPDVVDAWRLVEFLESAGSTATEQQAVQFLNGLAHSGQATRDGAEYKLLSHAR